jgi:hypothetical protein
MLVLASLLPATSMDPWPPDGERMEKLPSIDPSAAAGSTKPATPAAIATARVTKSESPVLLTANLMFALSPGVLPTLYLTAVTGAFHLPGSDCNAVTLDAYLSLRTSTQADLWSRLALLLLARRLACTRVQTL